MENFKNISPVKVDKTTIINLEKGKLPPQVLDLEEAVLGAIKKKKKGVDEVIDILQADAFYINDEESYVDQISGEKIQLLQNNLVISGLSKNEENSLFPDVEKYNTYQEFLNGDNQVIEYILNEIEK